MISRRGFLTGSVTLLATPLASEAQPEGKVYRVGFLSASTVPDLVEALRQGLHDLGWMEGQNFVLEQRSDDSNSAKMKIPELAADLVRRNVDVIVVAATAMPYLRKATADIPVVFGI